MILLVEDDALVCKALATVLEAAGYRVEQAHTGQEALDMLRGGLRPRLIVLDLLMPVMDGNAFLEHYREEGVDVPVILLTAYLGVLKQAVRDQTVEQVEKPVRVQEFLDLVKKWAPK